MEILIEPAAFILVPVVIGLVEALKVTGMNSRYAPLVSIVFGIALSGLLVSSISSIVLGGIVVGLMASGLYSGAKAAI